MRHLLRIVLAAAVAVMLTAGMGWVTMAAPAVSIEGSVRDADGEPIVGAVVTAYGWDSGLTVGEGRTARDGAYSIDGLGFAKYRVKAEARGYLPQYYKDGSAAPVTVTPLIASDNIDFALTLGGSISGRVCQADGQTPIPAARVVAYQEAGGAWEYAGDVYSDSYGFYSVTVGAGEATCRIKAEGAGYSAEYYANVSDPAAAAELDVSPGDDVGEVTFTLDQIGFISGVVYRADGLTPIPSARVAAYDNVTGQWVGEGLSDARAGTYYINLIPGTYRLRAEAPGYLAEWLGDATAFGAATPVSVAGLTEKGGIDFTLKTAMEVRTHPAYVSAASVRLNGNLTSLGASSDCTASFVWGTASGSYTHETPGTVRGSTGVFFFVLNDIVPGTTYYYRARAVGAESTVYGEELRFKAIDVNPPVISDLECDVFGSMATISWTTDEPATSQVDFGLTQRYGSTTGPQDTNLLTEHRQVLCDLSANCIYHYRVISQDASRNRVVSEDYTFTADAPYGGMVSQAAKIAGFAVTAVIGIALCFVWVKAR